MHGYLRYLTVLCANLLYGILPKSDNKLWKYEMKFVYSFKWIVTLTKPFSRNSQYCLWFFYIKFYRSQMKIWRKYGHFICAILQSTDFTAPGFEKHTTAQWHYMHITCIKFDLNRTLNMVITGRNSFRLLSKILFLLHQFSRNICSFSSFTCVCFVQHINQIGQEIRKIQI